MYPLAGSLQFADVTVDQTTGSVVLRIVVPNPDGILLPGMYVHARIEEGVRDNAILSPSRPLHTIKRQSARLCGGRQERC